MKRQPIHTYACDGQGYSFLPPTVGILPSPSRFSSLVSCCEHIKYKTLSAFSEHTGIYLLVDETKSTLRNNIPRWCFTCFLNPQDMMVKEKLGVFIYQHHFCRFRSLRVCVLLEMSSVFLSYDLCCVVLLQKIQRGLLRWAALFLGELRDGLTMINMQSAFLIVSKQYTEKQAGILFFGTFGVVAL